MLQILWQHFLYFARAAETAVLDSAFTLCDWLSLTIFSCSTVSPWRSTAESPELWSLREQWGILRPIVWGSRKTVQRPSPLRHSCPLQWSARCPADKVHFYIHWPHPNRIYIHALFFPSGNRTYQGKSLWWSGGGVSNLESSERDTLCIFYIIYTTLQSYTA